jgi:inosine-uridine nucleoside N-ribohydrolase
MSDGVVVFTAQTNIAEALELGPRVVEAFRSLGLMCPGRTPKREWCVASEKETLADAANYHEQDLAAILRALNDLRIPLP